MENHLELIVIFVVAQKNTKNMISPDSSCFDTPPIIITKLYN
jgi:hypothetical protein